MITLCKWAVARWKVIDGVLLAFVLIVLGLNLRSCVGRTKTSAALAKAAALDSSGVTSLAKADDLGMSATSRAPQIQTAKANVAARKAELKAIRSTTPPTPVEAKQDEVIQDQGTVIDLQDDQIETKTAQDEADHAAAMEFKQEADTLRKEVSTPHPRALGVILNPPDSTYGAFFEYDIWRLRFGVDVYQQRLPTQVGGGVKWATQYRAAWRF